MEMIKRILCPILLVFVWTTVSGQGKLAHLKDWVGKYPTYNETKPHRNFLKLPEINRPLQKLLSKQDYHFLTDVCGKEVPIQVIEDYLIVKRCHKNYCLKGTALLVINMNDGALHVAIRNQLDSEPRWFSTDGKYKELPFRIKDGFIVLQGRE